jgi:hypothetical protein
MGIRDLGIVHGILTEKSELLSGSPTARLHTIVTADDEGYEHYLSILEAEYKRRMDLQAGNGGQIAGQTPPARAPVALLEAPKGHSGAATIANPGASEGVGQTPHRVDERPVNIERKQVGDQIS